MPNIIEQVCLVSFFLARCDVIEVVYPFNSFVSVLSLPLEEECPDATLII